MSWVIGRGALAGTAGALAMSVSTNLEMRLRERGPSDAPAKALERLFGIEIDTERGEQLLVLAAHFATSITLGMVGAAIRRRTGRAAAGAALLGASLTPEVVVVPALGAAPAPTRWSAVDWLVAVVHHSVYAVTASAALR
jgi:hypothetical protein